jgi:predicted Rossmann fold nucleotide-binding protein DprA/Smf involved in DNA uptake
VALPWPARATAAGDGSRTPGGGRTLGAEERKIVELLSSGDRSLEELIEETGWNAPVLVRVLSELEGRDLVTAIPGQRYARI